MATRFQEFGDHPQVEAAARPVLRLVEKVPQPRMAPPAWMMAPPIPAEIGLVRVNEPQQPYLAIPVAPSAYAVPAAPTGADTAPYRSVRQVPRLG